MSPPYKVTNCLEKYIRLRQSALTEERGDKVTLQEVFEEIANYCGVSAYTITMIKGATSQTPSFVLAFLIRNYFRSVGFNITVDELFGIVPKEESK
ncbi:hypothetical protein [Brevibacillus laterosporus]|uniref:hypothetical protein n=1 Tax=Brevibacillus laterosporus TaxID=1465 RepID=UPI003D1FC2A5